jgi:RNA polymerase sigma-70 factor (ECF subfamily)
VSPREQLLQRLAAGPARRGFRIAYDLLGDRAGAEDAVQEGLARAWENHHRLRDPAAAEAWFYRIVTNTCLRALRRRRLRRRVRELWSGRREPVSDDGEVVLTSAEGDPPADELIARRAEALLLLRALDRLPAQQRAALVLRYGHDLAVGEVADLLGVGVGSAKTHLVRGLRGLRAALDQGRRSEDRAHERRVAARRSS